MADRKVLVKYYPPDFDFDKLQQKKKALRIHQQQQKRRRGDVFDLPSKKHRNKIMNVRMMYPFTLKCGTCSEFVYVGTKFNSRVERVEGEDYLGIVKWRFYGRCPHCRAEICFKTDPQNCDYVLEWGGTRMYEPLKDEAMAAERTAKEQDAALEGDRIAQVEASRKELQQEALALEQLAELRRLNRRLMDRAAASDNALAFLRERETTREAFAEGDEEDEQMQLRAFKAERELASDPESSEEEVLLDPHSDQSSQANDAVASQSSSSLSSSSNNRTQREPSSCSSSTEKRDGRKGSVAFAEWSPIADKSDNGAKGEVKRSVNFGLGGCVSAPKLLVVKAAPPPTEKQRRESCSALFEAYGSSSGDE